MWIQPLSFSLSLRLCFRKRARDTIDFSLLVCIRIRLDPSIAFSRLETRRRRHRRRRLSLSRERPRGFRLRAEGTSAELAASHPVLHRLVAITRHLDGHVPQRGFSRFREIRLLGKTQVCASRVDSLSLSHSSLLPTSAGCDRSRAKPTRSSPSCWSRAPPPPPTTTTKRPPPTRQRRRARGRAARVASARGGSRWPRRARLSRAASSSTRTGKHTRARTRRRGVRARPLRTPNSRRFRHVQTRTPPRSPRPRPPRRRAKTRSRDFSRRLHDVHDVFISLAD